MYESSITKHLQNGLICTFALHALTSILVVLEECEITSGW